MGTAFLVPCGGILGIAFNRLFVCLDGRLILFLFFEGIAFFLILGS